MIGLAINIANFTQECRLQALLSVKMGDGDDNYECDSFECEFCDCVK